MESQALTTTARLGGQQPADCRENWLLIYPVIPVTRIEVPASVLESGAYGFAFNHAIIFQRQTY